MLEMYAGAFQKVSLLELSVQQIVGLSSTVIGLGRPATQGTPVPASNSQYTAVSQNVNDEEDGNPNTSPKLGRTVLTTAWAVLPTVPAAYFRRFSWDANPGTGFMICFPRGIGIPANTSLTLWGIQNTISSCTADIVVEE